MKPSEKDLEVARDVPEQVDHSVPAIVEMGRGLLVRWRAWRLNRKLRQTLLDNVDDRYFRGGFSLGIVDGRYVGHDWGAYKHERERAKSYKFPLDVF